ncbi:hypothetical protein FHS27_002270 [Rhodopirellula rubra]|uniref:AMP-dependent synthetase/ligase domain-containing protein n=1 Tax=Aporhodopirellula rubra TaxID=980271 RepID=A0A7W5DXQ7_9BACT|nr:hypothetical protein [Aporhodopirellula rubra]MBB3206461.1 hypothetical protein [Aporhodopirellula rubra]
MIRPGVRGVDLGANQLSYAAGSSSLTPDGFRILGESDRRRLGQLVGTFPALSGWLNEDSLIISAYPASLGLQGLAPFVDTYLHPPTFIRSMRLAALDFRPVVMAAQPLVGAEMILRTITAGLEMPKAILWAVGGYYLPGSLESFIADELAQCGCRLEVLHCYGVAEIGHTCFAAMNRFESGEPRYQLVADDVFSTIQRESGCLELRRGDRTLVTEDLAEVVNGDWKIRNGKGRMCPDVMRDLESWSATDWQRRTGYLHADKTRVIYQLRESAGASTSTVEMRYYRFLERFGGSLQCKPKWHRKELTRRVNPNCSSQRAALA